jgi:uncharacterized protein Yka (UPF0111/DUF47 family)
MTSAEELKNFREELDKLILQNNDLIDQLRRCQNQIDAQESEDPQLMIRKEAILFFLQEQDFPKKIASLIEKIQEIETELNGCSRTQTNSPYPR